MQLGAPLFARSFSVVVVLRVAKTGLHFLANIALTVSIWLYAYHKIYKYSSKFTLGLSKGRVRIDPPLPQPR